MQTIPAITGPARMSEIIDRAFRLYRHYFRNLIILPLVTYIPLGLFQIMAVIVTGDATGSTERQLEEMINAIPSGGEDAAVAVAVVVGIVVGLIALVGSVTLTNATSIQAAHAVRGETLAVLPALRLGLSRFWGILGLGMLFVLAFIPLFLVLGILAAVSPALMGCGLILFVPFIIYIAGRMAATTGAFYAAGEGPLDSIRSSWRLTEGYVWRSLGFGLLIGVLSVVINSGIGAVVGAVFELTMPPALGLSLSLATTTVISALWLPVGLLANMLYYYDLRVRQDGYDLSLRIDELAEQAGES
ncbi:MAG: hypothetical protein R3A44_09540 [Caldilineaceae bacterium]